MILIILLFHNLINIFFYKILQFLGISPNVPAVGDVLPARIEKCVAFLGLAKCAGATAWEWSVAE
jgi:hypothetical protein